MGKPITRQRGAELAVLNLATRRAESRASLAVSYPTRP